LIIMACLQVDPPWDARGNATTTLATATRRLLSLGSRRLLDDGGDADGGGAEESKPDCKQQDQKQKCSKTKLEGGLFSWGVILVGVSVLHILGIQVLSLITGGLPLPPRCPIDPPGMWT
jgi:hypothetical protein